MRTISIGRIVRPFSPKEFPSEEGSLRAGTIGASSVNFVPVCSVLSRNFLTSSVARAPTVCWGNIFSSASEGTLLFEPSFCILFGTNLELRYKNNFVTIPVLVEAV